MDLLTHLFLPLTVAYVLRRELFDHPATLGLAGFSVLSDFDKFLGHQGLLHSLVTIVPVCLVVLAVEPKGVLAALGKIKEYFRTWPFAY